MKRAHRKAHLILWATIVPVTVVMFVLSLYLNQADPAVSDEALDIITQETE